MGQTVNPDRWTVREVADGKKQYLDLLLQADEQENMIDRYLGRGRMFVLEEEHSVRAECVVTDEGGGILEIKNLAVDPGFRKQGYGRRMIEYLAETFCGHYRLLQVGTGDSPLTVPFYESCGFRRDHVVKHFFTDYYDHPIYECGVQLVDMVYLVRELDS